jgi:hypothetical protein
MSLFSIILQSQAMSLRLALKYDRK